MMHGNNIPMADVKLEESDDMNHTATIAPSNPSTASATFKSPPPPTPTPPTTTATNSLPSDASTRLRTPSTPDPSLNNIHNNTNNNISSVVIPSSKNPLASLPVAKRKRLPQDKVGQLEDRIALDARDADAWLSLIREHQVKGKITDARNTYERFFKVFPDLVSLSGVLLM